MENIAYKPVGKEDKNLTHMKTLCKEAVKTFVEAMDKMEFGMRFNAFKFQFLKDEEVDGLSDIVSTAVAIELKEQAGHTLDTITYECSIVKCEEQPDTHDFWISAKKVKPDWSKVPKMEERPIEEAILPSEGDTLIEASGMGHIDSKQHIRHNC